MKRLELARPRILAYRLNAGSLDHRLPHGRRSLRRAAWGGLQDSAPRSALLSLFARVAGITASSWEDQSLVQLWGPRRAVYVVARRDVGVFSLGVLPEDAEQREAIEELAITLRRALGRRHVPTGTAARIAGGINRIKVAGATGTILIRWDGAHEPTLRFVAPPEIDMHVAGLELVRRYLHILGPGTAQGFARWAGIRVTEAARRFQALRRSLAPVGTPSGDAWILRRDEPQLREAESPVGARFLPSGDAYLLAEDRDLLVRDPLRRSELWPPSNVWPGGLLLDSEIVGTWRRSRDRVVVSAWKRFSRAERDAFEAEATSFPLGKEPTVSLAWR